MVLFYENTKDAKVGVGGWRMITNNQKILRQERINLLIALKKEFPVTFNSNGELIFAKMVDEWEKKYDRKSQKLGLEK